MIIMLLAIVASVTAWFVHCNTKPGRSSSASSSTRQIPQVMEAGEKPVGPPALVIKSRVGEEPWKTDRAIYPLKGEKVFLKVDRVPGATTKWYRIIPDTSEIYKNANHPWEQNPYKWIGFAQIKYSRMELVDLRGKWQIDPFQGPVPNREPTKAAGSVWALFTPSIRASHDHEDVGSFWFQVEIEKNGRSERSPGIEDSDKKGLSPKVFRVSIRDGKGYLGYLTSFFNVPGVFGSVPHQSNNYLGADCCDVLVAAYGKWIGKTIEKNYSVSMLTTCLRKRAEFDISAGRPSNRLQWGRDVHPGDFIAVRYCERGGYQHIGALLNDADKDGILSADDLVLHAGPLPLRYSCLKEGKFDGHVLILDPKSGDLAAKENRPKKAARDMYERVR